MDKQQVYVVTDQKGMDSLVAGNYQIEESTTYKDYQISLLSLPFLNPKTRDNVLRDLYFVRLEK
jgi:muramidase (phage lysozyme)